MGFANRMVSCRIHTKNVDNFIKTVHLFVVKTAYFDKNKLVKAKKSSNVVAVVAVHHIRVVVVGIEDSGNSDIGVTYGLAVVVYFSWPTVPSCP